MKIINKLKKNLAERKEARGNRNVPQMIDAYIKGKFMTKEELRKLVEYFYGKNVKAAKSYRDLQDNYNLMVFEEQKRKKTK